MHLPKYNGPSVLLPERRKSAFSSRPTLNGWQRRAPKVNTLDTCAILSSLHTSFLKLKSYQMQSGSGQ